MQLVSKRVCQLSVVLGGVLLMGALTPRALHAVAATMVLVTNTMGNPVITVPVNAAASQQILLEMPLGGDVPPGFSEILVQFSYTLGLQSNAYVVPAGQNLVVTGVDLTVDSPNTGLAALRLPIQGNGAFALEYYGNSTGMYQFNYPQGLVYAAGSSVVFDNSTGTGSMNVKVRGYLTPQ